MHPSPMTPRRRRVALYSHDTQGLGHTRRNILIAAAMVAARPDTDVLLLTGAPEATMLPLPPSTEVLTLPTLHKNDGGAYSPRVLTASLPDVLQMRARLIEAAVTSFAPDLLVVDKAARGVHGELDRTLSALRGDPGTRTVLGLRDVLDAPTVARREWLTEHTTDVVRELYDEVWVYGDPDVYDPVVEYALPHAVTRKVAYTGYLGGPRPPGMHTRYQGVDPAAPPDRPFVLCLVGGGQDGTDLARAFLGAAMPLNHDGVLLTGPYMRPEQRQRLLDIAARRTDITVHEFVAGAQEFVARAAAAVSMGGYNSVCELLSADCPTLIVPRVVPRTEQALRAERLAAAGWVDVLVPSAVSSRHLGDWLARATTTAPQPRRSIDLDGLSRIPWLVERLLGDTLRAGPMSAEVPHVAV